MDPNIPSTLPEILLVDKPSGITSYDVIRRLQRTFGKLKMGHAGTLDPMASGLMIIGVGRGTKMLETYLKLPKTYMAEILIGRATDTGDADGEVVDEQKPEDLDESHVRAELAQLIGSHEFQPPAYSAIKVDGKPLYWYARNNQVPPRIPIKPMTVRDVNVTDYHVNQEGFSIVCAMFDVESGTYIRTLAEELGRRLGYPAMLVGLRRLSIGTFRIEDAMTIE